MFYKKISEKGKNEIETLTFVINTTNKTTMKQAHTTATINYKR